MVVRVLSGGAAHSLVSAIEPSFAAATGDRIEATFSAVGAMRDKLLSGASADVLILTAALIAELERSGHVVQGSARNIGSARTALAVRKGDPIPPLADASNLRAALVAADSIYSADPERATAGRHFMSVIEALGIAEHLGPKLRVFPSGTIAMRELATDRSTRALGCTQATEIVSVPGLVLAGPLPNPHGLATVYTAGLCTKAAEPEAAQRLIAMLCAEETRALRAQAGFEPA